MTTLAGTPLCLSITIRIQSRTHRKIGKPSCGSTHLGIQPLKVAPYDWSHTVPRSIPILPSFFHRMAYD